MGIVNQSQVLRSRPRRKKNEMSNQQYTAFYMTLDKNDKEMFIEAKNMPKKALEEHFPESKVASIAKRGWAGKLKLKKKLNKVKKLASIVKPKKSLMPKMSKKRQSTDKLKGETTIKEQHGL